jgi:NADPH-dependent 2,4-dienoyl-CoA reductase/sulfur reductase-like enzyme
MRTTRYLIVGGGLTADGACRGIREVDPDGEIVVVTAEEHPPYARPPLSKALWKGDDESTVWCGTPDLGVDVQVGRTILSLDVGARRATDDRGETYSYERLLLATGGSPRRLDLGDAESVDGEIVYFRTLDDYRRLRTFADRNARALVVGGGFIGSEIAAALAMNGCTVTMVFPDPGICARIFPGELSTFVTEYYRDKGVEVIAGGAVTAVEQRAGTMRISTRDERTHEVDVVVAGIGIEPRTELAAAARLPVDGGIVVDERGRVEGRDDVYAAGDVARFPAAPFGAPTRVEHEDHAKTHGRAVGRNLAGADAPYDHQPFFYSDLFELGYEAVGQLDARQHETVTEWDEPNQKGVVYYLDARRRPRGVLLWNRFGEVDAARRLIAADKPFEERAIESFRE